MSTFQFSRDELATLSLKIITLGHHPRSRDFGAQMVWEDRQDRRLPSIYSVSGGFLLCWDNANPGEYWDGVGVVDLFSSVQAAEYAWKEIKEGSLRIH